MPFSWTETKEQTMEYIHENSLLHSLFFNPFVLCIILVMLVILIQYIFEKQYEEEDCSYLVTFRHGLVVYIAVSMMLVVHDMLIKNKYRMKIKSLETPIQATSTNSSISTVPIRQPIDPRVLNKLYQEE